MAVASHLLVTVQSQPMFYLDPSAGSMMLQLILGGLAGVAIALRLFWARILLFLGRGKGGKAADPETDGS